MLFTACAYIKPVTHCSFTRSFRSSRGFSFSKMSQVFYPVSTTKHLAKDSQCPEKPNVLRLYSMKFCPYAQRTRLVLAAKKIQNEVVNIHLFNRPNWYYEKNPLGKVPCLELTNGKTIYESLITCDYLDEVYPSNPLNSSDPLRKAEDRMLMELFNKVSSGLYKLYWLKPEDDNSVMQGAVTNILDGLKTFENELEKRGSRFFGGDKPGMLDYMVWPWMERLPVVPLITKGLATIPMDNLPILAKWSEVMKQDDAVKESYISPENHTKYLQSHLAGQPDYEMELN